MATITQVGVLGRTGPVMVDETSAPGKKIILLGVLANGQVTYQAKQPAFASNLTGFPYAPSDCALGPYSDNQTVGVSVGYKVPSTGLAFDGYENIASGWVDGTGTPVTTTGPSTTTGGGGGSTGGGGGSTGGGGTVTTGGGTTTGGTTTGGDTTFKAPTMSEQISTFLSNYWWLVLLILAVVLYKPVIAPALGLDKKKRSYR